MYQEKTDDEVIGSDLKNHNPKRIDVQEASNTSHNEPMKENMASKGQSADECDSSGSTPQCEGGSSDKSDRGIHF